MLIKRIKKLVFIALISLSAGQNCAAESVKNNPIIAEFQIRPSACVIEQDAACRSKFHFSWQLREHFHVCLVSISKNKTLYCSNEISTNLLVNINIEQDESYRLVPRGKGQHSVERTIEVKRLGLDARLLQRKIWSIF